MRYLPIAFLLIATAVFAIPGTPENFYGVVVIDGVAAPDGTIISVAFGSTLIASTTTNGGRYGYDPYLFNISDPNGDMAGRNISFFVSGVYANSEIFQNGETKKVNLGINKAEAGGSGTNAVIPNTGNTTIPVPGTPAATNASLIPSCKEKWTCADWSPCVNGTHTRSCVDSMKCGTFDSKPIESGSCTIGAGSITGDVFADPAIALETGLFGVIVLLVIYSAWRALSRKH
jgi:hypothetical protein